MKWLKLGLGCLLVLSVIIVEIYLIAAAFDGERALSTRFGYGLASLLILLIADRLERPTPVEVVERQHFDASIERLTQQLQEMRERQDDDIEALKDRIDRGR